jgi:hypothetical protein
MANIPTPTYVKWVQAIYSELYPEEPVDTYDREKMLAITERFPFHEPFITPAGAAAEIERTNKVWDLSKSLPSPEHINWVRGWYHELYPEVDKDDNNCYGDERYHKLIEVIPVVIKGITLEEIKALLAEEQIRPRAYVYASTRSRRKAKVKRDAESPVETLESITQPVPDKTYYRLPDLVRTLLLQTKGYLVGSAVEYVLDHSRTDLPRDWDCIVPHTQLGPAIQLLKLTGGQLSFNNFGGAKLKWLVEGVGYSLDVWGASLEEYLPEGKQSGKPVRLYRPYGNLVISTTHVK